MDVGEWYRVANLVAISGWILMALAPRWKGTDWIVHKGALPAALGLGYAVIMAVTWGQGKGSFATLAGVKSLFQHDWILLMGWVHYLAFDMFVGSWILRDSWSREIPHLAMLPVLFATLMFGPIGFLIYWVIMQVRPQREVEG